MKIILPKTLDKYSLKQAANLLKVLGTYPKSPTIKDMVKVISAVSELPEKELMRCDFRAIKQAFVHIIGTATRISKLPPKEVTIKGQVYFFQHDFQSGEWTGGRYSDADTHTVGIEMDPEKFVAICYIEKGTKYGDKPLKARAKIMKEHFRGDHFIDLYGFFLQKHQQLTPGYLVLQIARALNENENAATQLGKLLETDGGIG